MGISDNYEDGKLSPEQATYAKSMKWLTSVDPDSPGKTRVQMYVEKQRVYTQTVESKVAAFSDALKRSRDKALYPLAREQREAYDTWVNEHARTYRNQMQAAYMDWVITGKKEEVEHHFALVDVDSAMARVEASKVRTYACLLSGALLITYPGMHACFNDYGFRWLRRVLHGPFRAV